MYRVVHQVVHYHLSQHSLLIQKHNSKFDVKKTGFRRFSEEWGHFDRLLAPLFYRRISDNRRDRDAEPSVISCEPRINAGQKADGVDGGLNA